MSEITRMFELLDHQLQKASQAKALLHRKDGQWVSYSTEDLVSMAHKVAGGLIKLGVQPGDRVALISYQNRPEWTICDFGIQLAGAISVPVYPTISSSDYEYIFNDASVQYCFVGKDDLYDKVEAARPNVKSLKGAFTFDKQEGRPHWQDIFDDGQIAEIKKRTMAVKPDDLFTIIYTSGTTGNPKGVMLSHRNIAYVVVKTAEILPDPKPGENVLSFLPLCHIFERAVSYGYIYMCLSIHYTGVDNLGGESGDLRAVKPIFFTTVPRLLEKVYEAIYNRGLSLTGAKRKLFFWAISLTENYQYDDNPGGLAGVKAKIADKLIFSKWREAVGGSVRGIVTGAAPCPVKIARVFSAAGIPVREGYGLTETSPTLTVNLFEKGGAMLGTVGPVIDGVEILIDDSDGTYQEDEGEILARGPNIMMGYYNKPEATAEVMKEIDGKTWFCTGDIGKMVTGPNGRQFLKITDRKKQLLKTSGGKYVAPAPIENTFKEDFLIEHMMVIGDQRKFVSALIVPAPEALKDWCKSNDVQWTSIDNIVADPKVQQQFQNIIDRCNPKFSHIEQVKRFLLIPDEWGPVKADGSKAELTPTMKLKRRVILEKYQEKIDTMYE